MESVNFVSLLQSYWQRFICITALILLTGCASVDEKPELNKKNDQIIPLLPVPKNLQNRVWLEKFSFSFTGENAQLRNKFAPKDMLLQTELTEQGINIAAMSFSGIMLAQAQWQKDKQQVTSELGLASKFDAKKVLHDLQLVNWPLATLKKTLGADFIVEEQINSGISDFNKTRRFYHHDQAIIIIHYKESAQGLVVNFEQLTYAYRLIITRITDESILDSIH
jgi:hypothetical protein